MYVARGSPRQTVAGRESGSREGIRWLRVIAASVVMREYKIIFSGMLSFILCDLFKKKDGIYYQSIDRSRSCAKVSNGDAEHATRGACVTTFRQWFIMGATSLTLLRDHSFASAASGAGRSTTGNSDSSSARSRLLPGLPLEPFSPQYRVSAGENDQRYPRRSRSVVLLIEPWTQNP